MGPISDRLSYKEIRRSTNDRVTRVAKHHIAGAHGQATVNHRWLGRRQRRADWIRIRCRSYLSSHGVAGASRAASAYTATTASRRTASPDRSVIVARPKKGSSDNSNEHTGVFFSLQNIVHCWSRLALRNSSCRQ
jgi:hypothetical protein